MASRWETGIDDNPMYDDVKYNPKTYTVDLDDVGLNSLYVLDGECLAQIATILGKDEDAKILTADYERQKQLFAKNYGTNKMESSKIASGAEISQNTYRRLISIRC